MRQRMGERPEWPRFVRALAIVDRCLTCKVTCLGKQLLACSTMAERHDTDLLFKALADSSRRKLLDLLHAHDGRTLNELCEHLDMTRQGVTQHLDLLEAANLVATVRRGREPPAFATASI